MSGPPSDPHINEPREPAPSKAPAAPERVVTAQEILAGGHRVWIQHAAERYLLQVTRSGKLILTK